MTEDKPSPSHKRALAASIALGVVACFALIGAAAAFDSSCNYRLIAMQGDGFMGTATALAADADHYAWAGFGGLACTGFLVLLALASLAPWRDRPHAALWAAGAVFLLLALPAAGWTAQWVNSGQYARMGGVTHGPETAGIEAWDALVLRGGMCFSSLCCLGTVALLGGAALAMRRRAARS